MKILKFNFDCERTQTLEVNVPIGSETLYVGNDAIGSPAIFIECPESKGATTSYHYRFFATNQIKNESSSKADSGYIHYIGSFNYYQKEYHVYAYRGTIVK